MPLITLFQEYGLTFVPFRLSRSVPASRSSIGGEPPVGILPGQVHPQTRYLGTLGVQDRLDVSLFITLDYSSPNSRFDFFSAMGRLQDSSSDLVQFLVHPAGLPKTTGSPLQNELDVLGFEFGPPRVDPERVPAESGHLPIFEGHKVGGLPFFEHIERDVGAAFGLLDQGFVHILQLCFPKRDDDPTPVDWFFCDLPFHVFARKERDAFEFRYIWG